MQVRTTAARIAELDYYPVKGCAGVSVTEAFLGPAGLAHDREFMVVDQEGVFRSQRRDPKLAAITPRIHDGGARMSLRARGAPVLTIAVDTHSERRGVELFGTRFTGIDQGDAAAAWFSTVLGVPCRLVRVPPEHDRVSDGLVPGTSGYADSCAVHVVSGASLRGLNDRVTARGAQPVAMARFRPNLVVEGWDEPHTEDRTRVIRIGEAELAYAKPAIRCAVTLIDQKSGRRAGPEPIRTLADYRRHPEGVSFGSKFAVTRPGWLAVGDEVRVGEWGDSEV